MTSIFQSGWAGRNPLCLPARQPAAAAFRHSPAPAVSGGGNRIRHRAQFLTLWQAFAGFRQAEPDAALQRLHFISFENSPAAGRSGGGACALAGAGPYADELRAQWPLPLPGCHRLLLAEGRITLDLWFGDVNELLPQFDASMNNQVDAWFLDGFAPAKIPTCGPSNCSPPWRVSPGRKAASPPLPPPASCAAACNRPGFRSTVAKASAKT